MASPPAVAEQPTKSSQSPASIALEFENVSIAFDERQILDGISFRLRLGETKAIFGVAGSGKSTILKLALGLLKPDSGRIRLLGEEVTQMTEDQLFVLRLRVGIVFQESALFDSLTVRENVAFRLFEEGNLPESEIEERHKNVAFQGSAMTGGLAARIHSLNIVVITTNVKRKVID